MPKRLPIAEGEKKSNSSAVAPRRQSAFWSGPACMSVDLVRVSCSSGSTCSRLLEVEGALLALSPRRRLSPSVLRSSDPLPLRRHLRRSHSTTTSMQRVPYLLLPSISCLPPPLPSHSPLPPTLPPLAAGLHPHGKPPLRAPSCVEPRMMELQICDSTIC